MVFHLPHRLVFRPMDVCEQDIIHRQGPRSGKCNGNQRRCLPWRALLMSACLCMGLRGRLERLAANLKESDAGRSVESSTSCYRRRKKSKAGGRGGKRPTEAFYRRSAGRKNSDPVPYSSSAGGQAEGGRISASSI